MPDIEQIHRFEVHSLNLTSFVHLQVGMRVRLKGGEGVDIAGS